MAEQQAGQQHPDGGADLDPRDADVTDEIADADDQEHQQQPVFGKQCEDVDLH